ncbi:unnamed protein product [Pleuronectes platessa]|uniref:Uncharacterized protein n=1 Tax=Pleuronectes platessa TaxID=8262 RepID=A0A9N7U7W8_PLEPL|nr:unnamed protein product [Pleuronectes platessa]
MLLKKKQQGHLGEFLSSCKAINGVGPTILGPPPSEGPIPLVCSLPLDLTKVTEYISSLEHTHFSDGSSQLSSLTTITQQGQQAGVDLGQELSCEPGPEASELVLSQPVIQPLSIQELLRESGRGGRGLDLRGGSLMTGTAAAKAVCTLSTQADR